MVSELKRLKPQSQHKIPRKNRGPKPKLIAADEVLMVLMYYREYRTFFHLGSEYGLSEVQCWRLVTQTEKLLIKSPLFHLPGKKTLLTDDTQWEVVLVDAGLTHHSDRGVQYCCTDYVNLLQDNHIEISMTENGDPLENAIAERINGIMKEEFLNHHSLKNQSEVMKVLSQSVNIYNTQRPRMSCNMLTPDDVHQNDLPVQRTWKNYYKQKPTFVNPLQD